MVPRFFGVGGLFVVDEGAVLDLLREGGDGEGFAVGMLVLTARSAAVGAVACGGAVPRCEADAGVGAALVTAGGFGFRGEVLGPVDLEGFLDDAVGGAKVLVHDIPDHRPAVGVSLSLTLVL